MGEEVLAKEGKWITVYIRYGNRREEFKFRTNFNLRRVLEEAIRKFGLPAPSAREVYKFYYKDNLLSDLNKSLEHYGVKEGDELVLTHEHVGGTTLA